MQTDFSNNSYILTKNFSFSFWQIRHQQKWVGASSQRAWVFNQSRHDIVRSIGEKLRANTTRKERHQNEPTQQAIRTYRAVENVWIWMPSARSGDTRDQLPLLSRNVVCEEVGWRNFDEQFNDQTTAGSSEGKVEGRWNHQVRFVVLCFVVCFVCFPLLLFFCQVKSKNNNSNFSWNTQASTRSFILIILTTLLKI